MQITLQNIGKRFNREWIFRHVDICLDYKKRYAITGANGSGKSTLLQVIAGALQHNEGTLHYQNNGTQLPSEKIYTATAIAAPYLELIEEMTAMELLNFHASFTHFILSREEILECIGLDKSAHKQIRYFSSGMKQRLKLAQAFFSDKPLLLLDEPTTNLDQSGVALYKTLIENYTKDRLLIVCSNAIDEYDFCEEVISIERYKKLG